MKHHLTNAVATLLLIIFLAGCESDPGYEHVYTTRAIVVSLPGDKAYHEFIVHHEEISDYISITGSIGMNEMAMPIPVRDRSMLKGIDIGDKVELVFGERFDESEDGYKTSHMGVISITKLPDDTAMNLNQTSRHAKPQAAND